MVSGRGWTAGSLSALACSPITGFSASIVTPAPRTRPPGAAILAFCAARLALSSSLTVGLYVSALVVSPVWVQFLKSSNFIGVIAPRREGPEPSLNDASYARMASAGFSYPSIALCSSNLPVVGSF